MSGEALKWALDQEGSTSGMQALLYVLALRADENGLQTKFSLPYLAKKTRQSVRSITRLLSELEDAGVYERETSYGPTGGCEMSGRLRLDRQVKLLTVSERRAMTELDGGDSVISDDQNDETANESGHANLARPRSRQIVQEVTPNTVSGHANLARPPLYTNLEESLLSASASAREGEREKVDEFQKRLDDDWKRFCGAYPTSAAMDLTAAKRELGLLKLGDRDPAIRFAADYAAEFKATKRSFPKEAWRWLADRDFDRIAELRQVKAEKVGLKAPLVPVRKGTPAAEAWQNWHRARGRRSIYWTWSESLKCDVHYEPTLFPPNETPPSNPPESSTGPPEPPQSDEGDFEE